MLWILIASIVMSKTVLGSVITQLTAGQFETDDEDSTEIVWLQITVDQPYCIKQAVHKWNESKSENIHSCEEKTACTCKGSYCKVSTFSVSTEGQTKLPEDAASRTGCKWADTALLKMENDDDIFQEDIDHQILIHEKTGNGTDQLIVKVSGGQISTEKNGDWIYQTWFQVTLNEEVCVKEIVHNYAILPDYRNKYSCTKTGDCTCDGMMCPGITLEVSGGTENQKETDCKMGKTFKFMVTNDGSGLGMGYSNDVYQKMIISSLSGVGPVTTHTYLLVAILTSFYWLN